MSLSYQQFIESKKHTSNNYGFEIDLLNPKLKDFQRFIVKKAIKMGKCAIFADCGLGKTFMQLEWARNIVKKTNKPVLILCPLCVSEQTIQEGKKFDINVSKYISEINPNVYISNYEQLDNIDCSIFSGVVLDESSILKNYSGAIKTKIIENFKNTKYKLACTATPSPNDEIEIGNHSEFLNIMSSIDMVAKYFTTDKSRNDGNKYRLKKYAEKDFYKWIKSWAIVGEKPSDFSNEFDDSLYELPPLNLIEYKIQTSKKDNGKLFNDVSVGACDYNSELRRTKEERLNKAADIVLNSNESFIIWVKHNDEGEYLKKLLPEAVEVKGSDKIEVKEKNLLDFAKGKFRILLTKSKIAQYGLNFQNCNNQIFASLDFSFESLYQSIRRSYRFGQKNIVNIHLITTDSMENVIKSINIKKEKFEKMRNEIICCEDIEIKDIILEDEIKNYESENFKLYNGDCIELIKNQPDESIDYSFFSPPFGSLYVFSDNPKDMSNVKNDDEFYEHFKFLVPELFRVLKTGRHFSIHVMQSTTLKGRDGYYSIKDFRGDLIRLFQAGGFYFHGENMIRKDPKTAAIRTKNRQLMWGTTKKDSLIVRPGLADYILHFTKPGVSLVPVRNDLSFDYWCKIAEPIWLDIIEGDTLPTQKGLKDERHITATQLEPIKRCYDMYCNKGETVFSPFSGIGSEGYQAVLTDRKFIGFELKQEYHNQAIANLKVADTAKNQLTIF